jgi:hypothetical protein
MNAGKVLFAQLMDFDELRLLPPQAEPVQEDTSLQRLNSNPLNEPRGRWAPSASFQRLFYPAYSTTRSNRTTARHG